MPAELHSIFECLVTAQAFEGFCAVNPVHVAFVFGLVGEGIPAKLAEMGDLLQVDGIDVSFQAVPGTP